MNVFSAKRAGFALSTRMKNCMIMEISNEEISKKNASGMIIEISNILLKYYSSNASTVFSSSVERSIAKEEPQEKSSRDRRNHPRIDSAWSLDGRPPRTA